ncbi:MAG: glycosyltransferase [Alphaproteobacteria bacterium]|nr:glycosyltransferase [Alphaproteobacteria bacterium]
MAEIVLADDGIAFDGRLAEEAPLGGAESALAALAEALAQRGHEVTAFNNCAAPLDYRGVRWRPIGCGVPDRADLYIANRGDKLLRLVPRARRTLFWIHNPARYLLKWRYLSKLARRRPVIVFSGAIHAASYPRWAPAGDRVVIPLGISEAFRTTMPAAAPPPPRAVFTSNPLRGLDWLLDRWVGAIRPAVPQAELHVFSGARTYGALGARKEAAMAPILERARALAGSGVVLRAPVARAALAEALGGMRVFLYRGDPGETFCLSAGEAQAMGVPGVVQDIGSLGERIDDGRTGFIARDDGAFADAAIRLLTDDALWQAQHAAALASKRAYGWPDAAAAFEKLLA